MSEIKISGKTFDCESFGTPTMVAGFYQTTFGGPSKELAKELKAMLKHGKAKKATAHAYYGTYKGLMEVVEKSNSRVFIVRFRTFEYMKYATNPS